MQLEGSVERSITLVVAVLTLWLVVLARPAATQEDDFYVSAGRGNVLVNVPPGYDEAVPAPLIVLLHGYGGSGWLQELYMQLTPRSDAYGFLYAYPDGKRDLLGLRHWNATNACCAFYGGSDDAGYLFDLVQEIKSNANVDDKRVYFVGHSNGGFMSYRMACDYPEMVAAIASFAGSTWSDADRCSPSEPVHVLHMHGTLDLTILYGGGCLGFFTNCYPGAVESVVQWATFNQCDPVVESGDDLNLVFDILGAETSVKRVQTGCASGGSAELWSMSGAGHVPIFTDHWGDDVVEWLLDHAKP